MAKNSLSNLTPLTRSRVALLQDLTRAITAAVLQDDLDRAANLLEQRWMVLQNLDWSAPAEDLGNELEDLQNLDQSLMDFCQSWREALNERLQTLNLCHRLRQRYAPPPYEPRFIDLHK
jgi:predicted O-linked N-acetylglucosamine transferase (SPINDLY family)